MPSTSRAMTWPLRSVLNLFMVLLYCILHHSQPISVDLCCDMHYYSEMAKEQVLQIRLNDREKLGFQAAADLAGIPLSSWVRERLRLAAIRDLESAGQKIPFIDPIHVVASDA